MKQAVRPGKELNFLTPDELVKLLPASEQVTRIREPSQVVLNNQGNGVCAVYKVPVGFWFTVHRVTLDIQGASDPSTGNVPLNVAGKFVRYQRSGTPICYAVPLSVNAVPQVPGVESWGEKQGPYLRNGEVFEANAQGLTANAILTVVVEGVLIRPAAGGEHS